MQQLTADGIAAGDTNVTEVGGRLPEIDFLRGAGIYLMLWGHCIQYACGGRLDFFGDATFRLIYSFHMPFLMLISGYLFCFSGRRGARELVERRCKALCTRFSPAPSSAIS